MTDRRELAMRFGWLVAAIRGEQGMRDFEIKTGISKATISRIENGHESDLETARKLGPIVNRCACCGQAWPK